ncbi:hypothetical protein PLICRDRAFT_175996 [Plicaturopsis crispa FD-325 SS-3]|nr:hypothetical protein PLICRDRAFT_175996 [Plicaturopsis crispa FD-325 SS-3]
MLPTSQTSRDLNGNHTDVVLQAFGDRILVLVTQMGKVGNLIQATIPPTVPLLPAPAPDSGNPNIQTLPPPPAAIQLTSLLGGGPTEHMQTLHSLYASQIATIVWTAESQGPLEVDRKAVVVGVALRKSEGDESGGLSESERDVFLGVMSMLNELLSRT